jgi:hypothetical protein
MALASSGWPGSFSASFAAAKREAAMAGGKAVEVLRLRITAQGGGRSMAKPVDF